MLAEGLGAQVATGNTQSTSNILIADPDVVFRTQISAYFKTHGYHIHVASSTREMQKILDFQDIHLIIFDTALGGCDGLALCRRLSERDLSIVIISGNGGEADVVLGLELGADDYLKKPCNLRELLARVRAILRRREATPGAWPHADVISFDGFTLDVRHGRLRRPRGDATILSSGELSLLRVFVAHPRQILSRGDLLRLNRAPPVSRRSVDVQISRLRRKLHEGLQHELIRTIRGAGYMLDSTVAACSKRTKNTTFAPALGRARTTSRAFSDEERLSTLRQEGGD